MNCDRTRRTILLGLYAEVPETERRGGQEHIAACESCRLAEAGERRLHAMLAERGGLDSADGLLDRCRRDLSVALDAEPQPRVAPSRRLASFLMGSRLSPAYGLALAAAGFFIGVVALRLVPTLGAPGAGPAPIGAAVSPGAAVSSILSLESAPDRDHVRLSYDTSQRAQIEGSATDPAIRQLLVATVRDSLNAGLRLDAIEALGRHSEDDEVRRTLIDALLADDNAGARLLAIEALHGRMAADADVRQAMLDAVRTDINPGVRVRATDLLSAAPVGPAAGDQVAKHTIEGSVPAGAARLRVETAIGSIRLHPAAGTETVYRVHLRATGPDTVDARRRLDRLVVSASRTGDLLQFTGTLPEAGDAARGLAAEFDIEVPRAIGVVEVATGAGDIEVVGIRGNVRLLTRGGVITGRDLSGPLEAETRGGRIEMGPIHGPARLVSGGGGVLMQAVDGEMTVRTAGGDVRIERAGAGVQVESGGGNVRIERAGGAVRVATGGGNIDIGDVAGEVSAATAGGAIRVGTAAGVRCETAAGSIVLGPINGAVRAITSAGSIRARFGPGAIAADSDIQTWHGDVFVSLPEDMAITIRALVDNPVGRAIESDFPLAIQRDSEAVGRPLEVGEARLGGGGPLLKLRTLGGRIVIQKRSHQPAAGAAVPAAN